MKSGATLGGKWVNSGETVGGEAEDKIRGEEHCCSRPHKRSARTCARVRVCLCVSAVPEFTQIDICAEFAQLKLNPKH